MRKLLALTTLAVAATVSNTANASDMTDLQATLHRLYPKTNFGEITASPVKGPIYEVVFGKNVAYVDSTGRYFFFGGLFDMQTSRDLAAERRSQLDKVDIASLPLKDSFTVTRGTGKRQLYVLSDPDCPYCRELEGEIAELKDVSIHYFLYPIVQLHPNARDISNGIWCSKDRAQAWLSYMNTRTKPSKDTLAGCDTGAIDRNLSLGQQLGVKGTPTLISADGRMAAGLKKAADLNDWLDNKQPTKVSENASAAAIKGQ